MMGDEDFYYSEFELLSQVKETQAVTAWRINYKNGNEPATLWVGKQSVSNQEEKERVRGRMHYFKSLKGDNIIDILVYGFDKEKRPFYITEPFDTKGEITAATTDVSSQREAERRFMQIVKILSSFHKEKVYFGNLTPDSFLLARDGTVKLCTFLSAFKGIDLEDSYNLKYLNCFAPEILNAHEEIEPVQDVYTLGILAYWFFVGKFPYKITTEPSLEYEGSYKKTAQKFAEYHPWLILFLEKSLSFMSAKRFKNCDDALRFIFDYRSKKLLMENMPVDSKDSVAIGGNDSPIIFTHSADVETVNFISTKKIRYIYVSYFFLTLILLILLFLNAKYVDEQKILLIQSDKVLTYSELNKIKSWIRDKKLIEVFRSVEKLSESEDPLVLHFLSELALETKNLNRGNAKYKISEVLGEAIKTRLRSSNLEYTNKLFDFYLTRNTGYLYVKELLILCNKSLPKENLVKNWSKLIEIDAGLATGLFYAKQLDAQIIGEEFIENYEYEEIEEKLFNSYFLKKRFLTDLNYETFNNLSFYAKLFLLDNLSGIFNTVSLSKIDTLKVNDIRVILPYLALTNNPAFKEVRGYAKKESFLPRLSNIYLNILERNTSIESENKIALINAAFGILNRYNLKTIANWINVDSTNALLALLVDKNLDRMKVEVLEIYDVVAARNDGNKVLANFKEWVRKKFWKDRASIVKLIGMVTYEDYFEIEDFANYMIPIKDKLIKAEFLKFLYKSDCKSLVIGGLEAFGDEVSAGDYLVLLRHSNVEVRKYVIPKIDTNNLAAFKIIKDAYNDENDESVKALYDKYINFEQ